MLIDSNTFFENLRGLTSLKFIDTFFNFNCLTWPNTKVMDQVIFYKSHHAAHTYGICRINTSQHLMILLLVFVKDCLLQSQSFSSHSQDTMFWMSVKEDTPSQAAKALAAAFSDLKPTVTYRNIYFGNVMQWLMKVYQDSHLVPLGATQHHRHFSKG